MRRCHVLEVNDLDWPKAREQWPGLSSLVCIESARTSTVHGPEVTPVTCAQGLEAPVVWERRFYLSSLECDAARLLAAVRGHWGIENSLHWVLDVAFEEDDSRIRADHAAHNMATLRRLSLNLLRKETQNKRGVKVRRRKAGWDDDYLLRVITAF